MGKQLRWLAVLCMVALALTPQESQAQLGDLPQPSTIVPMPFGPVTGCTSGFYTAGEFMYWKQTNPMKSQVIANRGIIDADGTIGLTLDGLNGGAQVQPVIPKPFPATPGEFIGSGETALDVSQVSGPNNYTPGFNFTFGYRFENGAALEMRWIHLVDTRYSATASLLGPGSGTSGQNVIGNFAENTFITSPVFNFTPSYFGPGNTAIDATGTIVGSPIAMLGLWDGSTLQTITFVQRFDQWELTYRQPMMETECWRTYALLGPRITSMWERFTWRVVHPEIDGSVAPQDSVTYTNVSSNRLYGVHAGIGNEFLLGDTPVGAFSISLDLQGALFMDFFKGRPKYELGDRSTAAQHGRNLFSVVPEGDGSIMLWWYPYRGIVCRFGWEAMAFANTFSSPQPVDFNFGSITPAYKSTFRYLEGFDLGIGFMF
jgi:hypothetical protein